MYKYTCRICGKSARTNQNLLCSNICIKCQNAALPFPLSHSDINEKDTDPYLMKKIKNLFYFKDIEKNDLSSDCSTEPIINCRDMNVDEFHPPDLNNYLSFLHQNIVSIERHKGNLETVLSQLNFSFDLIGLTETRIRNVAQNVDLGLSDFNHFSTPTEMECGGTILYVRKSLMCKQRVDLEKLFYKSRELESSFVEITIPKQKSMICGCIYKHPSMDVYEFNDQYLNPLLDLISKEKNHTSNKVYPIFKSYY